MEQTLEALQLLPSIANRNEVACDVLLLRKAQEQFRIFREDAARLSLVKNDVAQSLVRQEWSLAALLQRRRLDACDEIDVERVDFATNEREVQSPLRAGCSPLYL